MKQLIQVYANDIIMGQFMLMLLVCIFRFEDYELSNMDAEEKELMQRSRMMMENFDPGDYLLDDEDDDASSGDWEC